MVGEIGVRNQAMVMEEPSGITSSGDISSFSPGRKFKKASENAKPYDVHELRSRRRSALTCGRNSVSDLSSTSSLSLSTDVVVIPAEGNCLTIGEISSVFLTSTSSSTSGKDYKDCMESTEDPELVRSSLTSSTKNPDYRIAARAENKLEFLKSENLNPDPDSKSTVQIKMPWNSEIEEFFAVAEKDIQKRFTEKYHFDIVMDAPLKGRYEWATIKP